MIIPTEFSRYTALRCNGLSEKINCEQNPLTRYPQSTPHTPHTPLSPHCPPRITGTLYFLPCQSGIDDDGVIGAHSGNFQEVFQAWCCLSQSDQCS